MAKQLFVWFTCRNYGRGCYQVEKENKKNCRPLVAERRAATMFVCVFFFFFIPSTRTFRALERS